MIKITDLIKVFPGGAKALDGLNLEVNKGEIMGLLGPNGAGKTTTIRVLSTLSGFDSGKVITAGFDVDREPEKVRESIGVVAQQTGVDYFLTGRENLILQGQLYRMKRKDILDRIEELTTYFELKEALDRTVATYSGGMRRKLDIATALIHRPKLLFLDEPTLGLDIKSRQMLWQYIEKLNREFGLTILLTTHYLEEADSLADRVAIISQGKIQALDTPQALKNAIHGDSVVLTFDQVDKTVQAFAWNLKDLDYVSRATWDNDKLYVYVDNGAESIPLLAAIASNEGITLKTVMLTCPTLDDVFLKYTGSSIDAGEEEAGDEWWKQWAGKGGGGKWAKQWQENSEEAAVDSISSDSSTEKLTQTEKPESQKEASKEQWPQQGDWNRGDWDKNDGSWQEGDFQAQQEKWKK